MALHTESILQQSKVESVMLPGVERFLADKGSNLLFQYRIRNPVTKMPLVEIVSGEMTSDETRARALAFVEAIDKLPLPVKSAPGFLVNRILVAYINAFTKLVSEGVDFRQIDRVMEAMGWPMGPALLQDVVGMDTGAHVIETILTEVAPALGWR